jgi:hypothetical protein
MPTIAYYKNRTIFDSAYIDCAAALRFAKHIPPPGGSSESVEQINRLKLAVSLSCRDLKQIATGLLATGVTKARLVNRGLELSKDREQNLLVDRSIFDF